jgi:general secretion pathway protein E
MVMATLHTNDAVGAITRLVDMGIEPFLLSSSVLGVLAQRLVRQLCSTCREQVPAEAMQHAAFPEATLPQMVWRAKGCAQCNHTGFTGRTGIYELLPIDEELKRLIHDGAGEHALRKHAEDHGMRNLRQDGMRWIAEGITTPEEILRVTRS